MKKVVKGLLLGLGLFLGFSLVQAKTVDAAEVKIYRLYNPTLQEHLFTSDKNEYNTLYQKAGWGQEGVAWYAPSKGKAVYRLYNAQLKNHLYTTDTNEVKVLTSRYGWTKDNGGKPLFYSGGKVGIYRLYNAPLRGMHLLTTDANEYNILGSGAWQKEGVKLYGSRKGSPIKTKYAIVPVDTGGTVNITKLGPVTTSLTANVNMTGSGSGYQAKIAVWDNDGTQSHKISFGLQYDTESIGGKGMSNKAVFLSENVRENVPNHHHIYKAWGISDLGKNVAVRMDYHAATHTMVFYGNGTAIGAVTNNSFRAPFLYGLEVNTKRAGDRVVATISNAKVTGQAKINTASGLHYSNLYMGDGQPAVSGSLASNNLTAKWNMVGHTPAGMDWDSAVTMNTVYWVSY